MKYVSHRAIKKNMKKNIQIRSNGLFNIFKVMGYLIYFKFLKAYLIFFRI